MELTLSNNRALRTDAVDDYAVGDVVASKYRLVRRVAAGAAGVVWEAVNTTIGMPVAIKLGPVPRRNAVVCGRLRREAQVAAMLTHPAVVRVFDYGESARGEPFLIMEMLEGETLAGVLGRENRLSPEAAVAMLLPIASGVQAAHLRGIVHRDLKPDNIVITRDDAGRERPKVVDFGVAMIRWVEQDSVMDARAVVGTPDYMAPEQALAFEVDHRADVWGFSVVLYEALSGETPFGSANYIEALCNVVQKTAPSLVERAGIDGELWEIVEKGLQKDVASRWSSMEDLGRALAIWLVARGVEEDVTGTSLRAHWGLEGRLPSNPLGVRVPSSLFGLRTPSTPAAARTPSTPAAARMPSSPAGPRMPPTPIDEDAVLQSGSLFPHPDSAETLAGSDTSVDPARSPAPCLDHVARVSRDALLTSETLASRETPASHRALTNSEALLADEMFPHGAEPAKLVAPEECESVLREETLANRELSGRGERAEDVAPRSEDPVVTYELLDRTFEIDNSITVLPAPHAPRRNHHVMRVAVLSVMVFLGYAAFDARMVDSSRIVEYGSKAISTVRQAIPKIALGSNTPQR